MVLFLVGTREGKTHYSEASTSFSEFVIGYLKYIFWCFVPPHLRGLKEDKPKQDNVDTEDGSSDSEFSNQDKDDNDLSMVHSVLFFLHISSPV